MDIPAAKVRKVLKIMQAPISLETPIGEEGDSHLGDFIADRARVAHPDSDSARGEDHEDALWFGGRLGAHAGGGWPRVRCHPRAHSPDRSQGAAQAAAPVALQQAQVISRRRARMTPWARRWSVRVRLGVRITDAAWHAGVPHCSSASCGRLRREKAFK